MGIHISRKKLIQLIEKKLGGKLICYIENPEHPLSGITLRDAAYFEEMLRSVGDSKKGILIVNSNGGDGNAAEKLPCAENDLPKISQSSYQTLQKVRLR